jgi:hypothetical protein
MTPEITALSTANAREWWRQQAVIDHTDWTALIDAAQAVLSRLRIVHGSASS